MKKPLVTFSNFTFTYPNQNKATLKSVNFTLFEGEKVLILGPSGSGKSTFSRCIKKELLDPSKGSYTGHVEFFGIETAEVEHYDISVTADGEAPESPYGLTINDEFMKDTKPKMANNPLIKQWIDESHIERLLANTASTLSAGENLKVSLSGVLVDKQPIFVFDEPLASLDPRAANAFIDLLDDIHAQTNNTIVIVEHRLEDVLYRQVDRIILFSEGRIISDSTPELLLKSDILTEIGVREPLWVTAMKYAGVDLETVENIDNVNHVRAPGLREMMEEWTAIVPNFERPVHDEPLLDLRHVSYRYLLSDRDILTDVNLVINKGEVISLVGENGAGKSTLSQIIRGYLKPQDGTIILNGRDLEDMTLMERRRHVGYLWENPDNMISQEIVMDEVTYRLRELNYNEEDIDEVTEEALRICGLLPFKDWPIERLSFGQKKRLTVASILTLRPELIILEEPSAGQDYRSYNDFMNFMVNIGVDENITLIYITHDIQLMLEYSDRTIVLSRGRVLADADSITVATSRFLINEGGLKETPLLSFAQQIGMRDDYQFIRKFIDYDRVIRNL